MTVSVAISGPVLLLMGPIGIFFSRLSTHLESQGIEVYKVSFPLHEFGFKRKNRIPFRGCFEGDYQKFLIDIIVNRGIKHIFMYGDFIIPHLIAIQLCKDLGQQGQSIETWVFELGYLRPNYATLEPNRVNCYSSLNQSSSFYHSLAPVDSIPEARRESGLRWRKWWKAPTFVQHALTSYTISETAHKLQPSASDVYAQLLGLYRGYIYKHTEKRIRQKLFNGRPLFLVVLQVATDSQLFRGSPYQSVEAFIEQVVRSFAEHAPSTTRLFIKHHPRDRGYNNYEHHIHSCAEACGVSDRLFYFHDSPLAPIFRQRHCQGCILINSSVGFQALFHGIPLKAMGKAAYNIEGLADQQDLDEFWSNPQPSDRELFRKFCNHTLQTTQVNGNFDGYFPFASVFSNALGAVASSSSETMSSAAVTIKERSLVPMFGVSLTVGKRLLKLAWAYGLYGLHWLAHLIQRRQNAAAILERAAQTLLKAFGVHVFMDRRDQMLSRRAEVHIANHNSSLDVLLVHGFFQMPAATTAHLHLRWLVPGFRHAAQRYGHLLLDHRCKSSRLKTLLKSKSVLQHYQKLFVFPSGSLKTCITSRFTPTVSFLARQQDALVIPWSIRYICDGKEISPDNSHDILQLLISRLTGQALTVICTECTPFDPRDFETDREMTECLQVFYKRDVMTTLLRSQ